MRSHQGEVGGRGGGGRDWRGEDEIGEGEEKDEVGEGTRERPRGR